MSVQTPLALPALPQTESLYVGRPPHARDGYTLASMLAHLHGRRFRGHSGAWVEVDATACPRAISGSTTTPAYPPGPTTGTETARHLHYLRTSARWLWVMVGYQADSESTGSPAITVQLYTIGGVLLDHGIIFDAASGTLATKRKTDRALYLATAGVSSLVYPVLWVQTGIAGGGAPSDPRLLSLDGASPRTRIEVRITSTDARVVAVRSWELPEADLVP